MDIKHAAEQVLFGVELEDKLISLSGLTDSGSTSPRLLSLGSSDFLPGRPQELIMNQAKSKHGFPSLVNLEKDLLARGHVMHFLANHELLALELMALALLKFPEAPKAFRQMILHTMTEEQDHLNLYIGRMKDFGVGFGELGLNDFFWKIISQMESPTDYVAWMSMTFEQANLDFSKHYHQLFQTLGDHQTADLMKVVYEDEIGHLGGGIRWFKKFTQAESLWRSWTHQLKGHLNPVRAKGKPFDVEGRRLAGLDEDYIHRIWTYQQSRGKSPFLGVWNSGSELIESGVQLRGKAKALQADLETLALHILAQDDAVLLHEEPTPEWLSWLKQFDFNMPEICLEEDLGEQSKRYQGLKPWAWDSQVSLQAKTHGLPPNKSNKSWKEVNSKINWKSHLRDFLTLKSSLGQMGKFENLIDLNSTQQFNILTSSDDLINAWSEYQAMSIDKLVLQAEYSVAGHHLRITDLSVTPSESLLAWVNDLCSQNRRVIVEPFYGQDQESNINLSLLYDSQKRFIGSTHFVTSNGKYRGHWLGPLSDFLSAEQRMVLLPQLKAWANFLKPLIDEFTGDWPCPCGIDLILYPKGDSWCLHPGLEINTRWTMGHLALIFQKKIKPGDQAFWSTQLLKNIPDKDLIWENQLKNLSIGEMETYLPQGKFFINDLNHAKAWGSQIEIRPRNEWN